MIDEIIGKKNMNIIYNVLLRKYNNFPNTKKELNDFYKYYNINRETFRDKIYSKQYKTDIVSLKEIINYKGKKRLVANLSIKDKFISRAITRVLDKRLSNIFSEKSFAYQANKGVEKEIKLIKQYIDDGMMYCAKIDIEKFFDSINHNLLFEKLTNLKVDDITVDLIKKMLNSDIECDGVILKKNKGIIQGNPLSPFLANIYLDDLDKFFEYTEYVRFSDDIFLFDKDLNKLSSKVSELKYQLDLIGLKINNKKLIIDKIDKIEYLGYKIDYTDGSKYEFVKNNRQKKKFFPYWHTSALRNNGNEYHIVNDGILTKKDFSIIFENEDKKEYLPIEVVDNINIYSSITLSSNFFEYINNKNIIVNFYNKHNTYIGKFIPNSSNKSALTVLNQVSIYNDFKKRMTLAKEMLKGSIYNILSNIKYYNRRYKLNLEEKIGEIHELYKSISTITNYSKLLLTEAKVREIYYSSFNDILGDDNFFYDKRNRRPPKDRINCLISFGNTILYNYIAQEIYKTTLDIRIAYVHSSNNRYESLNLDIADIFKPVIVDKVIFKIINKKMIKSSDFDINNNYVYLSKDGKEVFIREIYDKLRTKINENGNVSTYGSIIRKEIYKILNYINNCTKYRSYRYY